MESLQELERISRKLDPSEEERLKILEHSIEYSNDYLNRLPDLPGFAGADLEKLDKTKIQEEGKSIEFIIEVLKTEVDSSGINGASGRHLGFIPGGGLWACSVADMLADTTNKYTGIAFSGPASVKMENKVIRWMADMISYPSTAHGNLTSGGSIANLTAIKAARDFYRVNSSNVKKSVIYFGEQTHHSISKALNITGLYEAVQRRISLTSNYQLNTSELEAQIIKDKSEGLLPFLVVASAGTTDTGAIDPLDTIADICMKHQLWYHVDAAYGGFFLLIDKKKEQMKGIERSDSITLDPHKTLFLPFGSGAVLVRDVNLLLASNSAHATYLADTEGVDDVSPADTGIELTRPNRGLRMWLPLQLHGITPFKAALQEKLLLTKYFYKQINDLGFQTGPYPDLTVSIFRYPGDEDNSINRELIKAIQSDGRVFLSSTTIDGKLWLRCAIVSHRTHLREVELTLQVIKELAPAIQ